MNAKPYLLTKLTRAIRERGRAHVEGSKSVQYVVLYNEHPTGYRMYDLLDNLRCEAAYESSCQNSLPSICRYVGKCKRMQERG